MKKRIFIPVIGGLLLLAGLSVLFIQIRNQRTAIISTPPALIQTAAAVTPAQQAAGFITGNPVLITVPSVGISVPITPGYYNAQSQEWTLTLHDAQYATVTPAPNNQSGNTFIYGHARSEVFGSLHKVQQGAEAIITTDNNHTFYYQLSGIQVVSPTDSAAVLTNTAQPTLTLQTCTGLLWQSRQLFSFSLEKVT